MPKRVLIFPCLVVAAMSFAPFAGAQTTAPLAAPAATATSADTQLLDALSSPDAAVREKAARQIEAQIAARIAVLSTLETAEASDRAAEVLAHHAAVLEYLRDILAQPAEQRSAALRWAMEESHLALISAAFSPRVDARLAAPRRLLGDSSPEADALLVRLIKDRDWDVSGAAIAAASKHTPTGPLIDALWDRAITVGTNNAARLEQIKPAKFHNKVVGPVFYGGGVYDNAVDNAAFEALVAMKSPLVEAKIVDTLKRYIKNRNALEAHLFQPYMPGAQNFTALFGEYKPRAAVPILVELIASSESAGQSVSLPTGNFFWSNRTFPLVMFLRLTGQDPADFQLARRREFRRGQWAAPDAQTHHDAEAKALAWFKVHQAEFADEAARPKPSPSASAPATAPSASTAPSPSPP